jgi:cytoskeletal protein RodZ
MALAAVGAAGYLWYRNKQGAAASSTAATDTTGAVGDDVQGQLSTIQTEIQNLQGSESQEGSTTPVNSGTSTPGTSSPGIRHVSTGKETLNQIAKGRNTSVAHIVAVSSAGPESKDNLAKLLDWAKHPGTRRKGIVYYTSSGPVQGATA